MAGRQWRSAEVEHVGADQPQVVALLHLRAQLDREALLQSEDRVGGKLTPKGWTCQFKDFLLNAKPKKGSTK